MSAPHGHVLVVGVGGIGCPCAIALAEAGVSRVTLVDSDTVDPSNLPRQVLFRDADVGRRKAEVAAERLARPGLDVAGRVTRFDASTAKDLLHDVDVVVDATDGAASKDAVHSCAVAARVPVVHAAALGSEGRVLGVAAGGRPCLACAFGLLSAGEGNPGGEGADTCARFGVWPGVAGAVGFLAAAAAIAGLRAPGRATTGLSVLDLGADRAVTLALAPDPRCPVCAPGADPVPLLASRSRRAVGVRDVVPVDALDLRDESCPLNLLRARRAMDATPVGAALEIWLADEGASSVPSGLEALGHAIVDREERGGDLRVVVRRRGMEARGDPSDGIWLQRFARQIVLPEVGEEGQRAWGTARMRVTGAGDAAETSALYLRAAGVGTVERDAFGAGAAVAVEAPIVWTSSIAGDDRGPLGRARGALLADAAMRAALGLAVPTRVAILDDGRVGAPAR